MEWVLNRMIIPSILASEVCIASFITTSYIVTSCET